MLKFVDREIADRRDSENCEMKDSLLRLNKECQELKQENANLKDHVSAFGVNRFQDNDVFGMFPSISIYEFLVL